MSTFFVPQMGAVEFADVLQATTAKLEEVGRVGLTTSQEMWRDEHNELLATNLKGTIGSLEWIFKTLNTHFCLEESADRLTENDKTAYGRFRDVFGRVYTESKKLLIGIENLEANRFLTPAIQ